MKPRKFKERTDGVRCRYCGNLAIEDSITCEGHLDMLDQEEPVTYPDNTPEVDPQ